MTFLLCADLHWHHLYAQDTGTEIGIFEIVTEVAVVIEKNIMEDLATTDLPTTDLPTSALDLTVVGLSVTAIAPHRTVSPTLHLLTDVYSNTTTAFGRISLQLSHKFFSH